MGDLITAFQEIEHANLRVVATLENVGYEIEYIRDDLVELYNREDLEACVFS